MTTLRFISCVRFSIQLLLAELAVAADQKKRKKFKLRVILSLMAYFAAAAGVFTLGVKVSDTLTGILSDMSVVLIVYYFALFGLTLTVLAACYDIRSEQLLFCGVCGYSLEHLTFCIATILSTIFGWSMDSLSGQIILRFAIYISADLIFYMLIMRRMRERESDMKPDPRMILLSFILLFTVIILSVFTNSQIFIGSSIILRNVICRLYGIVCCVLAIASAFGVSRNNYLRKEAELMECMLHSQKDQQKLSKDSINIINIKSHDLKHRLNQIQRIRNMDEQKEYIDEIRSAVTMYDNIYRTGNESLDLVLTEKSIYCQENGIQVSSMIDGKCVSFITSADIYVLFGNLLDNAIESVMKEPDIKKRLISINISRRGGGSLIHMENYCPDSPSFEDGLPVTTKPDRNYHGFGVRSIRYIAEKYHGNMLMQMRDSKFIVDILFYQ